MRAPSFKGLRDDKLPDECVLERPRAVPKPSGDGAGSSRKKPGATKKPAATRKETTAVKKTTSSGSKRKAPTRR
jgi:hypothetical protein